MRTIIAGSRHLKLTPEDIDEEVRNSGFDVTSVLCGGALGADTAGRRWAEGRGIPVTVYPADWAKHGKSAGPMRNELMATNADALILIWDFDSRGSFDMRKRAEAYGLKVFEVHATPMPSDPDVTVRLKSRHLEK